MNHNNLKYTICQDDDFISGGITDLGPLFNMGEIIVSPNPQPKLASIFPVQGFISIILSLFLLFGHFIFN